MIDIYKRTTAASQMPVLKKKLREEIVNPANMSRLINK